MRILLVGSTMGKKMTGDLHDSKAGARKLARIMMICTEPDQWSEWSEGYDYGLHDDTCQVKICIG